MPRISAVARALPANVASQEQIRNLVAELFHEKTTELDDHLEVFANSRIDSRQFVMPPEWYAAEHTAQERNSIYLQEGVRLLKRAAESCLAKADVRREDVDHIICVSTTGHATPSLEARLVNAGGFRTTVKRTPIWGLGCAAGAAGLAKAAAYCRADQDAKVLLLALECCSLTFRKDDNSLKNLVGTALFADGAAAALLVGDKVDRSGPEILSSHSQLFPDTERIMGWDFDDNGMQLVLSPKLPALISRELAPTCQKFLAANGLGLRDIKHYIMHPGGARVVDAIRKTLTLGKDELKLSEDSLRKHGNISSVSILMILEDWLATKPEKKGGYGLMAAFGPGFSAELLLLEA